MRGPGKMLGEQHRLIDIDQASQPLKVVAIERGRTADRQANTMDRQRIFGANLAQEMMGRTTRAHVILSMNLEEIDAAGAGEDISAVLGLKPDSGERRCIKPRK